MRGQAFTQAPQAVHLSGSTSGSPVCGSMRMASNAQAAESQTAERAGRLADVERRRHGARPHAVVPVRAGALLACAAAADRRHLGLLLGRGLAQIRRHGLHAVAAAHRAEQRRNVVAFHERIGHAAASGESAAAAVRPGEHLLHLVDARVLLDPEFPGHEVEHHGREHSQRAQRQDRVK